MLPHDFQQHYLIGQGKTGCLLYHRDPTPEALRRDNKRPHDDDDEIREVPDEDRLAEPPKKKKKKNKNKNSKEAVPTRKDEDDGT